MADQRCRTALRTFLEEANIKLSRLPQHRAECPSVLCPEQRQCTPVGASEGASTPILLGQSTGAVCSVPCSVSALAPACHHATPGTDPKVRVSCQGAAGERQALPGLERQLRHVGVCGRVRPQQELDGRDVPEVLPLLPHACPGALGMRFQGPLTRALAPSTACPNACPHVREFSWQARKQRPSCVVCLAAYPGTRLHSCDAPIDSFVRSQSCGFCA